MYWFQQNSLSLTDLIEMEVVAREILAQEGVAGTVIDPTKGRIVEEGIRKATTIAWLRPYDPYFEERRQELMRRVENAMIGFGHRVSGANGWSLPFRLHSVPTEQVQITSCTETGYYDWHVDAAGPNPNSPNRRLSLSLLLSAADEGGELQFKDVRDEHLPRLNEENTIVAFPSNQLHTVSPVTKGERLSLVLWMSGEDDG